MESAGAIIVKKHGDIDCIDDPATAGANGPGEIVEAVVTTAQPKLMQIALTQALWVAECSRNSSSKQIRKLPTSYKKGPLEGVTVGWHTKRYFSNVLKGIVR